MPWIAAQHMRCMKAHGLLLTALTLYISITGYTSQE